MENLDRPDHRLDDLLQDNPKKSPQTIKRQQLHPSLLNRGTTLDEEEDSTRLSIAAELEIYLEIGGFSSFQWLIWGHIFVRQVYTFFHPDELGPDDDDDAVDDEGTAGVAAAAHVTAAAVALTVPIFNERDKNTNCKIIAWSPLTLTPVYFKK